MSIEVEELLKPRYKVIADYPGNPLAVGMIGYKYYAEWVWPNGVVNDIAVEVYPHLFRKLEWWEERKPEEMPEYIRRFGDEAIIKPDKWILVGNDMIWHTKNPWMTMAAETCEPATLQSYQQYHKSIIK